MQGVSKTEKNSFFILMPQAVNSVRPCDQTQVHPPFTLSETALSLSPLCTSCFIWNQFPSSCLVSRGKTLLSAVH